MNRISVLTLVSCLITGVVIGMGYSSSTLAATIYVDATNNSGIEDGTQMNPYNTIQEGINAATRDLEPMDVVSVAPGIYIGQVVWKSGVMLQSQQGPELRIVDGNGASTVFVPPPRPADLTSGSPRGFIDGFTVRNNGTGTLLPVYSRYAPYQTGTLNVDNCVLEDADFAVRGSIFAHLKLFSTVIRNVGTAITGSLGAYEQLKNVPRMTTFFSDNNKQISQQ